MLSLVLAFLYFLAALKCCCSSKEWGVSFRSNFSNKYCCFSFLIETIFPSSVWCSSGTLNRNFYPVKPAIIACLCFWIASFFYSISISALVSSTDALELSSLLLSVTSPSACCKSSRVLAFNYPAIFKFYSESEPLIRRSYGFTLCLLFFFFFFFFFFFIFKFPHASFWVCLFERLSWEGDAEIAEILLKVDNL